MKNRERCRDVSSDTRTRHKDAVRNPSVKGGFPGGVEHPATTLPMQIDRIVFRNQAAVLVDVNPNPNPFRESAKAHPTGVVLKGPSGEVLPKLGSLWQESGAIPQPGPVRP